MRSANSVGRGLDGRDAVDEQLGLLEDDERLLVQLRSDGDVSDFGNVVVVEPVDVVHDARLVGLQQVLVLAKLGAALQSTIFSSSSMSSLGKSTDMKALPVVETGFLVAARSAPPS